MAIISGGPTPGDDWFDADDANDIIDALAGDDIVGGGGNDFLFAYSILSGGPNDRDTLTGGSGRDRLLVKSNVFNDKALAIARN